MSAIQGSGLEGCLQFRGLDQRGPTAHSNSMSGVVSLSPDCILSPDSPALSD